MRGCSAGRGLVTRSPLQSNHNTQTAPYVHLDHVSLFRAASDCLTESSARILHYVSVPVFIMWLVAVVVCRSNVSTYCFEIKTPSMSRCTPLLKRDFQEKNLDNNYKVVNMFLSSSSYICHGVRPLVDPFRSHVSRSLFKGLP